MSFRDDTIDGLLADSLIQTVMRADHVEPEALKALLTGAASRIAAGRDEPTAQRAAVLVAGPPSERRAAVRATNGPSPRRAAAVANKGCGTALCC
jgi:hypothetical protein